MATFHFFDDNPRHLTQVLAFDRHHGIREFADHFLLLRLREYAIDQFYIH
jgi:hypothetical protein